MSGSVYTESEHRCGVLERVGIRARTVNSWRLLLEPERPLHTGAL